MTQLIENHGLAIYTKIIFRLTIDRGKYFNLKEYLEKNELFLMN
jgi:hypothetical protein